MIIHMGFFRNLLNTNTKEKYFFNWSWTRGSSSSLRAIGPGGPGIIAAEKKIKKDLTAQPVPC